MIELSSLYLFLATSLILCLVPGPDNIYVLAQGISKSKIAAIITTLGLATGTILHTTAAALGISVLFQTSEIAFDILKYLGAVYLLYIAYQAFKYRNEALNLSLKDSSNTLKKLYLQGFIMNILNPKVSIFFLAFLPQFIQPENGNIPLQIITLGLIFMIMTIVIFSSIGIAGNTLSTKLSNNKNIIKYLNIITSVILVTLALKLAFTSL